MFIAYTPEGNYYVEPGLRLAKGGNLGEEWTFYKSIDHKNPFLVGDAVQFNLSKKEVKTGLISSISHDDSFISINTENDNYIIHTSLRSIWVNSKKEFYDFDHIVDSDNYDIITFVCSEGTEPLEECKDVKIVKNSIKSIKDTNGCFSFHETYAYHYFLDISSKTVFYKHSDDKRKGYEKKQYKNISYINQIECCLVDNSNKEWRIGSNALKGSFDGYFDSLPDLENYFR